ncbi:hypothetical protein [Actinoplanes sp. NPDC023714]|uniref:hypothetical protein n=1 Tax=Actinoplanes sp. NPDC023714 TaxID=3154322 RepID=UPI0033D7276B
MMTHLPRPLTRRYRAELIGHDLGPAPARFGSGAIFAVALLLSALLVGLATAALY